MHKYRFIGGLVMILAAALLMLTNQGRGSTTPYIGLAVVGIALVATGKKRMRAEKEQQKGQQ
jgi:uncharacterized membrane protein